MTYAEPISSTKALTADDLTRYIDRIFRPRSEPKRTFPEQHVDWELMRKHKICGAFDNGTYLMSPSEMKRAHEVGAIWNMDENGERIK